MMNEKHQAYNVTTKEIITSNKANAMRRAVKDTSYFNSKYYGIQSCWYFCHDGGKQWDEQGLPRG